MMKFWPFAPLTEEQMKQRAAQEASMRLNPIAVWFDPPPPVVLRKQLREAELQRAEHAINREYHAAMEQMLIQRIARLTNEVNAWQSK